MLPLWDSRNPNIFPFWVVLIIVVNIFVFYLELTSGNPDAFIFNYGLVPQRVNFLHLETLIPFVTSQFVHGGFLHIISNMWFLWIFGDNVEDRLGFIVFPIFYLVSGVIGNFLEYIFNPTVNISMIGASGAIAGILGAYYAFFPRNKVKTLIFIIIFVTIVDLPASVLLFYWFIIQLFSSAVSISATSSAGGIAWFAHIGGFAAGWVFGKAIFLRVLKRNSA